MEQLKLKGFESCESTIPNQDITPQTHGSHFINCKICGKQIFTKSSHRDYCSICKKEVKNKYMKEYGKRPEVKKRVYAYLKEYFTNPEKRKLKKLYNHRYIKKPGKKEMAKNSRNIYRQKPEIKKHIYAVSKKQYLKKIYKLTMEQYDLMLKNQNNKCVICGMDFKDLKGIDICIDHCHTRNIVRGVLCRPCNIALGIFKDNIFRLQSAIDYLKKHGETNG